MKNPGKISENFQNLIYIKVNNLGISYNGVKLMKGDINIAKAVYQLEQVTCSF
jgi:hypothetical protein